MLPQAKRVNKTLFKRVLEEGSSFYSPSFSLKLIKTAKDKANPSRFSVSISKKTSKLANVRNRIRRQLSAVLERLYPSLKDNLIGVLFVKGSLSKKSFEDLERDLLELFKKSGSIK